MSLFRIALLADLAVLSAASCAAVRGHLQIRRTEQPVVQLGAQPAVQLFPHLSVRMPSAVGSKHRKCCISWRTDLAPRNWGFGGSRVDLPAYQLCEREAPSARVSFSVGKCKCAGCRLVAKLAAERAPRGWLVRRVAELAALLIAVQAAQRLPHRLCRQRQSAIQTIEWRQTTS